VKQKEKENSRRKHPASKQLKKKIMKTKIKTLIAICILGFIGLININAIADNKKNATTEETGGKAGMMILESEKTDDVTLYSAKTYTFMDIENEIENYGTDQVLTDENAMSLESLIYSPEAFTSLEFANEMEMNQVLPLENVLTDEAVIYSANAFANDDVKTEIEKQASEQNSLVSAEAITAAGADREIERYVNKLIDLNKSKSCKE
jgi:hypothetical protein